MRGLQWRFLRHINNQTRSVSSDSCTFQPGDLVLLREKLNRASAPFFPRPLKSGAQVQNHRGVIPHDDIIGKRVRDVVSTLPSKSPQDGKGRERKQTEFRLHEVKLEEYVRLTKRLVTPVYPADAGVIVDLLDLHPGVYRNGEEAETLEILEAGTGHGALTLYLSRAIHASNPPLPKGVSEEDLQQWKARRRAVVHTIERKERYSKHAKLVVKGFRHGLYYHNVDFHVSDVSDWTLATLSQRNDQPFLSHAILDLPNADSHLSSLAQALKVDGTLLVFNPSLTQILQCYRRIKEEKMPLELETVIELPVNGGARGREWDVRAVRPRALQKERDSESVEEVPPAEEEEIVGQAMEVQDGGVDTNDSASSQDEGILTVDGDSTSHNRNGENDGGAGAKWEMVCRPKVGDRIVGGGFLGVFKKQRDMLHGQI